MYPVAGLEAEVTIRYDDIAAALYGAHKNFDLELLRHLKQRHTVESAAFFDLKLDYLRPALGKSVALEKSRVLHETEYLARGRPFGVDSHIEAEFLTDKIHLTGVLRVPHTGNGVLAAKLARDDAADHVQLVLRCDRKQEIRSADIRLALLLQARPVSVYCEHVERLAEQLDDPAVVVYQHDVVLFIGELVCYLSADLSSADDYDFHNSAPLSMQEKFINNDSSKLRDLQPFNFCLYFHIILQNVSV